jgi:D-threo-aldose 1-dehydrogenase
MLIHDPSEIDPTLEKGGTLEGLLKCKDRGLVRHVGYGMHPHEFHLKAIATGDVDLLLCFNDYNLVRQSVADTILPAAAEADIGVMNGWSILRGILTDVDIDAEIERGRWKKEGDVAAAYPIWKWCLEEDISILQLAIQFCLREERIHGNNIGSLNVEQLEANVRAASTPLPDEVWEKYEAKFGSKN